MHVEVLGPFEAQVRGRSFVPSAAKPRQVLALLSLRAGRLVTVPTLMEEIWGSAPPRSAPTTLQTYILQIRRRLAAALGPDPYLSARDVVGTRSGGYVLNVPPGASDAAEFERLSMAGRAAYEANELTSASRLLGSALALWQGPALTDVPTGSILDIEVLGLREARMATLELRIATDLRLGRHAALISELAVLTAEHPMHENLHHDFMLALHRSGQTWRALDVYRRLRATLIEELALEPSPRVRRLQQAILARDPDIALPPTVDPHRPSEQLAS